MKIVKHQLVQYRNRATSNQWNIKQYNLKIVQHETAQIKQYKIKRLNSVTSNCATLEATSLINGASLIKKKLL